MKKELNQHKIKEFLRSYGTFFALLAIILVFSALRPSTFATLGNFVNITKQMSILAVCALGATLIMCVEEFDLSIGTIASFGGILAAKLAVAGCSFVVCLLAATAACALLGYMNGFIVTKFGVMSFIITLASSTMIYGFSYWLSDGATIFSGIPKSFSTLGTGKALGIPYLTMVMVLFAVVFYFMLKRTVFGRSLYAIGGNTSASAVSGINVKRCKAMAFMLGGAMAGVAGVLMASRLGSAHPTGADSLCLNAFAAIFIGKTLFKEGVPNVIGTIVGVAVFSVLSNGLTILTVPSYIQNIITGLVIMLAVVVQKVTSTQRI